MNFLEKLNFLMDKYGLTKRTLSQKSEIPYTTIDNWYKRGYEGLKLTTLRKLNDFFNTTLDYWILDEITDPNYGKTSGFKVEYDEMEHVKKYRSLDHYGQETINIVLERELCRLEAISKQSHAIDTLKSEANNIIEFSRNDNHDKRIINYFRSVSAGTGIFVLGNEVIDQIAIPDTKENRNVDYAIKVNGDSMYPDFNDGDTALVSQKTALSHGDIGIFIINNNAYIKEFGSEELISRNPDSDNIIISEYDNIVCMGKVVGKLQEEKNDLSDVDIEALHAGRRLLEEEKPRKNTIK